MFYLNRDRENDDDPEYVVRLNRLVALLVGMVILGIVMWTQIDWDAM
ncbi:hypothetical protein [Nesterenkonia alba]|nr:hypothetical protein [Nesterenkonia alba]